MDGPCRHSELQTMNADKQTVAPADAVRRLATPRDIQQPPGRKFRLPDPPVRSIPGCRPPTARAGLRRSRKLRRLHRHLRFVVRYALDANTPLLDAMLWTGLP